MWIRLPKRNASNKARNNLSSRWLAGCKLLAIASCAVWVVAQVGQRLLSQDTPVPNALGTQPEFNPAVIAVGTQPLSNQQSANPAGTQPNQMPWGHSPTATSGTQPLSNQQPAYPAGTQPTFNPPTINAVGTQLQLQQPAEGTQPLSNQQTISQPSPQPIMANPAPREVGQRIVHKTLHEAVWGLPMMCEVRQSIQIADKKRSSFGKYVRSGKGLGKMRMTLQVPAADQMNSLFQVSDGDLLTTFESIGNHSMMSQIDLLKVQERLRITPETYKDPVIAMYLAIGGQAEVLRKVCQKYDWTKVTDGQLGDQKVWWIRGIASAEPVGPVAKALVDVRLFEKTDANVFWPNVKLAIGQVDSKAPFWLYQVETWSDGDADGKGKAYVMTEWDSPIQLKPQQLTPDLFQSSRDQSISEVRDETKIYLPPASSNMAVQPQQLHR